MTTAERPDATVVNALQEGPGELERTPPQFSFEIGDDKNPLKKREKKGNKGDQDRGIVDENGIAIVCDGMGSETGGETAEIVVSNLYEHVSSGQLNGMAEDDAVIHIEGVLIGANSAVAKKLASGELQAGSGTTLGAIIPFIDNEGRQKAAVIGVGDTPVMRARGDTVTKLTEEETVAAKGFSETGEYDESKAHVITNAFDGRPGYLNLDGDNVTVIDVEDGDRFVVTSDGIEELYSDPSSYPATSEKFTNFVCDTTIAPAEVARTLTLQKQEVKNTDEGKAVRDIGTVHKVDDQLVYVVDAHKAESVKPSEQSGDHSDTPKRRRGKRGSGEQRRREAERDARTADKAAREDLPSADPDDVPNPIGEDWDPIDATSGDQPYDREVQDPEGDWEGAEPSDDGSDPFDAWRPFFEGNDRDDDSADPDFSHLPPPPDASSGNPGHGESDDATPYSHEQRQLMESESKVIELRDKLGQMQTTKRWSFAYGFIHRKEMRRLRQEYEEAICRHNEHIVFKEIRDGTLSSDYDTVLDRIDELEAEEGQRFIDANANAELTRYGKAIRWVGDKIYGEERTTKRRFIAGAGMGVVALGAAAAAPALPAIAGLTVSMRLFKAATGGVSGHDSEKGTRRILTKVAANARKKQAPREQVEDSELSATELRDLLRDRDSSFRETYLDSINKSDTKRRVGSLAAQAAGIAGAVHYAAPVIKDIFGDIKLPFSHGGGSGSGFKNLSPDDVQKFKDASPGISQETLSAIDKNPEAFNRFVTTGEEIKQSTGLSGAALNERLADTLELAHAKNEFIDAARGSGISAQVAGETFDRRMAEMVFADAVNKIKFETGLTGDDLLHRVQDTAALAHARDSFVSQGATASERFNRGVLFDEQFKRFVENSKQN